MEGLDASSVSTSSDSVVFDAHNIWNPTLELLFHVQFGGIFEIYVEEIDWRESRLLAIVPRLCLHAFDMGKHMDGVTWAFTSAGVVHHLHWHVLSAPEAA